MLRNEEYVETLGLIPFTPWLNIRESPVGLTVEVQKRVAESPGGRKSHEKF